MDVILLVYWYDRWYVLWIPSYMEKHDIKSIYIIGTHVSHSWYTWNNTTILLIDYKLWT